MISMKFKEIEPSLLTDIEAATFLRLTDDDRSTEAAIKSLNRIVDRGLLRPCLVGKHRRYSLKELQKYIDERTEAYG